MSLCLFIGWYVFVIGIILVLPFLTPLADASTNFPQDRLNEFFIRISENGGNKCVAHNLSKRIHLANKAAIASYNSYYQEMTEYARGNVKFFVLDDIVGVEDFMVGQFPHFRDTDEIIADNQV